MSQKGTGIRLFFSYFPIGPYGPQGADTLFSYLLYAAARKP
ncbi:hypothetical protein B0I18_101269 [Taibaiella chishuiensis]|uniref:Uncharacterized protein n=1 Tax=Taibaiella chishuiensis TaxID=1434707 RepID=A0A2P8DA64_9BACT|nr:hypothetical protein B0I18_101269 [Taibaiella chishuiensis]